MLELTRRWLYGFKSRRGRHSLPLEMPILPAELMDGYEVSKSVNNPQNDSPECIAPL